MSVKYETEVLKNIYENIEIINDETSDFYVRPDVFEAVQQKGFKVPIRNFDGVYTSNSIVNLSNLKKMKLRSDDVLLTGYPKSGKLFFISISLL